jgi:hypothetical protein
VPSVVLENPAPSDKEAWDFLAAWVKDKLRTDYSSFVKVKWLTEYASYFDWPKSLVTHGREDRDIDGDGLNEIVLWSD